MSLADLVREYRKLATAHRRARIRDRDGFLNSYVNAGIAARARNRHESARQERFRRFCALNKRFLDADAVYLSDLLRRERNLLDNIHQRGYKSEFDQALVIRLRWEIRRILASHKD